MLRTGADTQENGMPFGYEVRNERHYWPGYSAEVDDIGTLDVLWALAMSIGGGFNMITCVLPFRDGFIAYTQGRAT